MADVRTLGDHEPVIIGVGQYTHRLVDDDLSGVREPVDLLEEALRLAVADCGGSGDVAKAIDRMGVVQGLWSYPDPARLALDRLGSSAHSFVVETGGNMVQAAVIDAAEAIAAGSLDVAVVAGTEAHYSRKRLRSQGDNFSISGADMDPAARWGSTLDMDFAHDRDLGFNRPLCVYPLFDSAIRSARGATVAEHEAVLGNLWASFNEVAVAHPDAWNREPMDAQAIVTPARGNRMVSTPYTKAMVADPRVNQAGAVIVASAARARELGVPLDRWVFLQAASSANDTMRFSERQGFDRSPALDAAAAALQPLVETPFAEIDLFDLYSCFPSMVQITAATLGLPLDRPLTVTGGLSFFGGPLNSYVIHAIVTMVEQLRAQPAATGLVHGNGGYATKHNLAVYSTDPGDQPFAHADVNAQVDHRSRGVDEAFTGVASLEAATVVHDRNVAPMGLVTLLTDGGERTLAQVTDADAVAALESGLPAGTRLQRATAGVAQIA